MFLCLSTTELCTTTRPGLCGPGIEPWALRIIVNHSIQKSCITKLSPAPTPLVQPLVQGTYECGSKIKLTLVKHSEFFLGDSYYYC